MSLVSFNPNSGNCPEYDFFLDQPNSNVSENEPNVKEWDMDLCKKNLDEIIPYEIGEIIKNMVVHDYARKTELCKEFKINEIWKTIKANKNESAWPILEEEFKKKGMYAFSVGSGFFDFIYEKCQEINRCDFELKDEVLKYFNYCGMTPYSFNDDKKLILLFFEWLGEKMTGDIKKLYLSQNYQTGLSTLDFYFICPNLKELHLDVSLYQNQGEFDVSKLLKDLETISLFPHLKTIKLLNFSPHDMNFFVDALSKYKAFRNLILSFGKNGKEENIDQTSCIEKISHLKNLKKLNIYNYWSKDTNKVIDDIGKLTQITHLAYERNLVPPDISQAIQRKGIYNVLPKNIKYFSLDGRKRSVSFIGGLFDDVIFNLRNRLFRIHPRYLVSPDWIPIVLLYPSYKLYRTFSESSSLPTPSHSLITERFGKIGALTAGLLLTAGAGLAAYNKFRSGQIKKIKAKVIRKPILN